VAPVKGQGQEQAARELLLPGAVAEVLVLQGQQRRLRLLLRAD
jgi:hypothetical protein